MPLTPIPGFCGGSTASRARGVSAERTVNMRAEFNESFIPQTLFARSQVTLFPRAGKKRFLTLPTSPVYGMWSDRFRVFVASGGVLYEIFFDGTNKKMGEIAMGGNPATMRANGHQLLICSAGNVYLSDGQTVFRPIVSFASGTVKVNGTDVAWVDGDKFQGAGGDIVPGNLIMLGTIPTVYQVRSVSDPNNLVLDGDAGMFEFIRYQVGTEYLTGVMPEFVDGYFIVTTPNSKRGRISNLNDGSKWDELDFFEKSGSIDNIAAVIAVSGQLGLIGDHDATEIWGDSGNADFPFERISGRNLNMGTSAAWSVAKMPDGSVIWLMSSSAGENMLVRSIGGEPVRISDHAFETALSKYPRVYDAISSTYLENGHPCYRIDFPSANRTWEWDQLSGMLVELGIGGDWADEVFDADLGRYRAQVTWPDGSRMELAGDYSSGKIFEVSPDFVDDDGVDFPVLRIGPHLRANWEPTVCSQFALDCEMGTIDPAALGPDGKPRFAMVSMAYSNDGARTWTDGGAASLGRAGEYEGAMLTPAESTDASGNSQTNPQTFEAVPIWKGLGSYLISRTFKIKSTGRMLRALYNGLVELSK
jgi:hypothetical protein